MRLLAAFLAVGIGYGNTTAPAQTNDSILPPNTLKVLSLEELMDLEVTSVSRRPEKLSESPSSVQVITQDDIRRSGATSLPEALRLAGNLEVAQIDSRQWAISSRGFNNTSANKMLVLIDGRSVYTPLYAGVFWDVQDTILEDIDRIEVISGPGATQWGANAVNGVINITTKSAKETQGLLVLGSGGSELRTQDGARYGGRAGSNAYYRVYGKYFDRDSSVLPDGDSATNDWHMGQGGARLDWDAAQDDLVTFQGDIYQGEADQAGSNGNVNVDGGNLLGRWGHQFANDSDVKLQLYYDHTHREIPGSAGREPVAFAQNLDIYDVDFQHHFMPAEQHEVVWGLGYRRMEDAINNSELLTFLPPKSSRQWFSGFAQDTITLVPEELLLTPGLKIEHNEYTDFEYQPSARLAWLIDSHNTAWTAVSRAVRTPSRIDREFFSPATPPFQIAGGPDFTSENLTAYEAGYRTHVRHQLALSIATFYNVYTDIRSAESIASPAPFPVELANGQEGETYGGELAADWECCSWWLLRAGYTELRTHLRPKDGSAAIIETNESNDPERQFLLRSSWDLPHSIEFDATYRYIAEIDNMDVSGYSEMDLRLGWLATKRLELAVVGQNLLHDHHAEFGNENSRQEIERSVYGKVVCHF